MSEKNAFNMFRELIKTFKTDGLGIKEMREKVYNEASDEVKKKLVEIMREPFKYLLTMIFIEHTIDEILLFQDMLKNEIACVKQKDESEK